MRIEERELARAGRTDGCLGDSDDAEDHHAPEEQASQEEDDQRPIQRLMYRVASRADCDVRNLHGQSVRLSSDGLPSFVCGDDPELGYLRIEERELERTRWNQPCRSRYALVLRPTRAAERSRRSSLASSESTG